MDWLMHGSTLTLTIVGTIVGAKLLGRARAQRALPEFAVGLALVSYAAAAQGGRFLSLAIGDDAPPELQIAATVYRVVGYAITLGGLAVFTWQVFGKDSRWRQLLAGATTLIGLVSSVAIIRGSWMLFNGGPPTAPLWRVLLSCAFLVAFLWTAIESLRYYRLMRRRAALGLADPLIANRFLVWGGGAAASTLLTIIPVIVSTSGQVDTPISMFATTAAGLLNALVWWLSFTPPERYVRWVSSASQMPTTPGVH